MSSQARNDDVPDSNEAAEEEEVLKLEEEVREMAQKIVDYRTTLSSSLLESMNTVLSTHLLDQPQLNLSILPQPDASASQDSDEAEKIRVLKEKIKSNVTAMPIVLNRMKEYMGRIDSLDSSSIGIIHPAFKRKPCV